MVSDPKAYLSLVGIIERRAEQVLPVLEAELAKRATCSWNDRPLNPSWTTPDVALRSRVESSQGILTDRFAFCQTMPLDECVTTAEALRESGYRPQRFRPYADERSVRVAAVWARDGRNWRLSSGVSADQVRNQDEQNKRDKYLPVEVTGYVTTDAGGKRSDHYAALWVEKSGDDDARMYWAATAGEETEVIEKFNDAKLIPRTLSAMTGSDGRTRYCGVWGRPRAAAITGQVYRDQLEGWFEHNPANLVDRLLKDVAISGLSKPRTVQDLARDELERAEKKLETAPENPAFRMSRAMANFRLGENQKVVDDLQVVIGKNPEGVPARQYRVITLARQGKKKDAQSEAEKFQKGDAPEHSKLYLAAVLAAELGEGVEIAFATLNAALQKDPTDADLLYDAARAFSLGSNALSRSDKAKGRQLAERSLQCLRDAVNNDDSAFAKMDEDADFDPVRDDSSFREFVKRGHADRRLTAVWTSDASLEAMAIYGVDPATQERKCRELIALGFRPSSLSLARTAREEPLATVSVWHRPVIAEEIKDKVAERQARAAVALLRMGKAEKVTPLLQHSADPRLRSFIINWLRPLGADPTLIAAELNRIYPNLEPARGGQKMDVILYHRETSVRRALIQALGTYGRDGLSSGEREPLIDKLLALYRDDPDSGIHGAAECALLGWGQHDKLKEVDVQLMKLKDWGERRWFVNGQGQTFAVIEGPVGFAWDHRQPRRNASPIWNPSCIWSSPADSPLPPRR